jgi:adhesin transport system membrane fusion protein
VKPGETLLELTPHDEGVVIEARATPADRGPLRRGQAARLRVAAFDHTQFGTLPAQVDEISADTLVDEKGERYFRVALSVAAADVHAFGQPLSPGMTVSADVLTGQRTVAQFLLSPVRGLAATALRER